MNYLQDEWDEEAAKELAKIPKKLALEQDAKRYRWLRQQTWWKSQLAIVYLPKEAIKLGSDTYSEERLDEFIDRELKKEKTSP